jgi:uncharacterized coiled-coil DUF342 family protein
MKMINRVKAMKNAAKTAALAAALAIVAGCGSEENAAPSAPESYMKDESFRKELSDFRKRISAVASQRRECADRMQALIKEYGEDLEKLGKVAEWVSLHKKITELNKEYEELRRKQLETTRGRIAPQVKK